MEDEDQMNKLISAVIISLVVIGCDSGDNKFDCTGGFPDGECLAEELSDSCFGFFCETDPPTFVLALFQSCSAVDCSTLDCGNTVFTELEIIGDGKITSQVFVDDQDLGVAQCGFSQP